MLGMSRRLALGPALGLSLSLSLGLAAAACTDDPEGPEGPAVIGGVLRAEYPYTRSHNLDLLFVIDNSPTMAPQRTKLLQDVRRALATLEAFPGGLPDVHIGVITTDVGTRGPLDGPNGPSIGTGPGSCTSDGDRGELRRAPSVSGNFISDISLADGTRERNYTGSLADAFVQLADAGTAGCTYVRPLDAAWQALAYQPANAGFLRDHAFLAIVLLTNDDDCSFDSSSFTGGQLDRSRCETSAGALGRVSDFVTRFRSAKPDPRQVLVMGAFAPPGPAACADVRPAPRLAALLDGFPDRSLAISICEQDWSGLMQLPRPPVALSLADPCFGTPLFDTDPVAEGLQPDCASWYRLDVDGELTEEILPACRAGGPAPCYRLVTDPINCIDGSQAFRIVDGRKTFGLGGAVAVAECVTRWE
jgi:hypothetical protein